MEGEGELPVQEDEEAFWSKVVYCQKLGYLMLVLPMLSGRGGPADDLWMLALMLGPFWLLIGMARWRGPAMASQDP